MGAMRLAKAYGELRLRSYLNEFAGRKEYPLATRFRWVTERVLCVLITNGRCWWGPLHDDEMFGGQVRVCRICRTTLVSEEL